MADFRVVDRNEDGSYTAEVYDTPADALQFLADWTRAGGMEVRSMEVGEESITVIFDKDDLESIVEKHGTPPWKK